MEYLETFNHYYRYVYIPIGIALAGALIYLLVSALPLLKTLKSLTPGLSRMSGTLDETKKKTEKLKETTKKSAKGAAVGLSALAVIGLLSRILKKGDDDKVHVVDNLKIEVGRFGRAAGAKQLIGNVSTVAQNISRIAGK